MFAFIKVVAVGRVLAAIKVFAVGKKLASNKGGCSGKEVQTIKLVCSAAIRMVAAMQAIGGKQTLTFQTNC